MFIYICCAIKGGGGSYSPRAVPVPLSVCFGNGPSCAACVSLKLHRAEANLGANRLLRQLLANGNRLDLI